MTRAGLDKQPRDVARMFDAVAAKYDLTNTAMTAGHDAAWRRVVRDTVAARRGERILDIAAGTGVSSRAYADAGVEVVPADFSLGMLREGRRRRPDLPFVAADATCLPFADASFDVVTMTFGLRNVVDVPAALAEFRRVVRPGGRLVVAEFSHPRWSLARRVYLGYIMRSLPAIAGRVSSDPESYVYLAESIRGWPDQAGLAERFRGAGWVDVTWRDLTGGVVAVHTGWRRD